MEKEIESIVKLVEALPELYQPIYGFPEISGKASRFCLDRFDSISNCYLALKNLLGRDLRVLDLGCAQGFFSFTLAELGASVDAIDYCKENIDLCNAIAARNPNLKVSFQVSRLEDKIGSLSHEEYDIILGLSVLHHVIHEHGKEFVKDLAHKISDASRVVILELALQEEPIYWGKSQPANPKSILEGIAFVHQLSKHKTHLSEVERPLIVASNSIWILDGLADKFDTWTDKPHAFAQNTHEGSRRYFFSQNLLLKHYQLKGAREEINNQEFSNEKEFLSKKYKGFKTPRVITIGSNENEGWVILKKVSGRLLLDILLEKQKIDPLNLVLAVLKQLVALESFGLYHNDVRCWNILVTENGNPCIIDYGSISSEKKDAVWPDDLILAFLIFVHEVVTGIIGDPLVSRTFAISPARLPEPYRTWALGFWDKKDVAVSFKAMYESLLSVSENGYVHAELSPHENWFKAIEVAVQECKVKDFELYMALNDHAAQISRAKEEELVSAQSRIAQAALDARLSTLTEERDALQQQLHEIHQANHGHWQLAESLKQELAAKEQTWSEERSTLDTRLSSLSSEHSSLVTSHSSLIAERDALATERNTLLAECSTLDARLSTLVAERDALATRHQLLATERAALASRIEEVAGEAAVARAQSESLRQELTAKEESLAAMRETLAAERSAAELRLSTLSSEHTALVAERNELATRHQLLVTERAALASRIEEVAGEAAVARAQSEGLRQELAANEQAWSEERSSLDARLSTLVTEHEALHQANHGHWQLAESLKQDLAAKEQAWSEERSTLDSRLSTLVAERDALLASTCWRITAPIRWMRGGVRIPWPAPNEPLDDFFLKHAALYIRRRPHLKERALQFLFRNPKWHARVLPVLQGIKASTASPIAFQPIPQPLQLPQPVPQPATLHEISPPQEPVAPVTAAPSVPLAPPIDLASLTPHARRIYADLKKAIEIKKGEVRA